VSYQTLLCREIRISLCHFGPAQSPVLQDAFGNAGLWFGINRAEKSRVAFVSAISGCRAAPHISVGPSWVEMQCSPQLHQQKFIMFLVLVLFI